jgi:hypothetical protein
MIFPYWEDQRDSETRWLPMIPVTLIGPARRVTVMALVDSGAEHSLIGTTLARRLGLDYRRGRPVILVGAGEFESDGFLTETEWQLGKSRWTSPVMVSDAGERRTILGQIGFFAEFNINFRYVDREIGIRRRRQTGPRSRPAS